MKHTFKYNMAHVSSAVGKGLIAGLVGTAAITISMMIEKKIKGDETPNTAPADAVTKTLDIKPETEADKPKLAQQVHWTYGTLWGIVRGLLRVAGLKPEPATFVHFAAVTGAALIIEPATGVAPPVKDWDAATIASTALHHGIYAAVTGLVYEALD